MGAMKDPQEETDSRSAGRVSRRISGRNDRLRFRLPRGDSSSREAKREALFRRVNETAPCQLSGNARTERSGAAAAREERLR